MKVLALETSCDETGAAVVSDGCILSSVISSQVKLHAEYGGVVPELAAREHLKNLLPVARTALAEAGLEAGQLDAVAATQGPGLPTALIVGFKAAQAVAFALRKPFVGIHHHEAHLYSPWIIQQPLTRPSATLSPPGGEREGSQFAKQFVADFSAFQPNISLIVSGGHTLLVLVESELNHRVLGSTMDDAAGECFDKTGKMMGLAYPAGPEMDRLAEQGNPRAHYFPRPMIRDRNDDFSFSGLKTSVRYFLRDHPKVLQDRQALCDLCASIQEAIVDVLMAKTFRAAERLGVKCITVSGGVACNRRLREKFMLGNEPGGMMVRFADKSLCTDNAAMIGIQAERKLLHKMPTTDYDAEIQPGWVLA